MLGNFPGQRREVFREEVLSRVPLFAVGGYMWWNKQTQERLVTPSWQPRATSYNNKQLGGGQGTETWGVRQPV